MKNFRTIVALLVLGLSVQGSFGATVKLSQSISRDQLRSACGRAGGIFQANLDGHNCSTKCTNSSGAPASCIVDCNSGGSCTGTTPDLRAPTSQRLDDLLAGGRAR